MKKFWPALLMAFALILPPDADARRMGGGKSFGQQSGNVSQRNATPNNNAPTQNAANPSAGFCCVCAVQDVHALAQQQQRGPACRRRTVCLPGCWIASARHGLHTAQLQPGQGGQRCIGAPLGAQRHGVRDCQSGCCCRRCRSRWFDDRLGTVGFAELGCA